MSGRDDTPDVCVIGAGLAGGLVAFELARRGVSVVVLEAGPWLDPGDRFAVLERALAGENPWPEDPGRDGYTTAGAYTYPLNSLRVKAVGGTTQHWTALTHRMQESDFALRRLYGLADDWPIGYAELERHYTRAEALLGVSGADDNPFASQRRGGYPLPPFPFSYADERLHESAERVGVRFHHAPFARSTASFEGRPPCLAFGTCASHRICPISAQYTADTHVNKAMATGRAKVVAEARVVRLETDASDRVRSAAYVDRQGRLRNQTARVFILAAHAVESARLLLLSQSGRFPHGLANRSGMVGRFFMEHPLVYGEGKVAENLFPYRIGFHTAESWQFANPPHRAEAAGFRLSLLNQTGPDPAAVAARSGQWGAALRDEVRARFGHSAALHAFIEQLPDPENRVTLDPEAVDDRGDPVPRIEYGIGPHVRAGRERALAIISDILTTFGASEIYESGAEEFGVCGHEIGTCRMGNDPDSSVVDRNLRAHGVGNLFVLGSSVFVTAGPLNPSLTIAALAVRLGEYLAKNS